MFFLWILRWLAFRSLAVVGGGGLYLFTAVNNAPLLRKIQVQAARATELAIAQLPDTYAVWAATINLTGSLTFLAFVLVAMLVIDLLARLLGICAKAMGLGRRG